MKQLHPGGQIYRHVTRKDEVLQEILGVDYQAGVSLADRFLDSDCHYLPGSTVWKISHTAEIVYSINRQARQMQTRRIIIANGALERPMPIPGWTLPGVMTVGAAQILLKSRGIVVQDAILAGCGPLLYLLAAQLIKAGCPPRALVETQSASQFRSALRHLPAALKGWSVLGKGISLLETIRRARVPRYRGATELSIAGDQQVSALNFRHGGHSRQIDGDAVLLHQGVIPNTQLSQSLGLEHHWHPAQRCFTPTVDLWGVSSNPLISIAGDGAGIGGAVIAELQGKRVALRCLESLGLVSAQTRDQRALTFDRQLRKQEAVRPFIDTLYAPSDAHILPANETTVCRCEDVSAEDIRRYAAAGCVGPNQTKAYGRSGMGPCQGRYCAVTVTEILAKANGLTPAQTGSYRIRSPIKPVTLGELASLHPVSQAEQDHQY